MPCVSALTTSGYSIACFSLSAENMLSRLAGRVGGALVLDHAGAIFGDFAGARFVLDDLERIARRRHARQAEDLDRHRRTGFLDLLALVVDQRTDLAALGADDEDVADLERAAIDEDRRDRAAALVELGLDHGAFGRAIGVGAQFEQFGLELDLLDQRRRARSS